MIQFAPYIGFNGRAEEAMTFYQSVFGGEIEMMRASDAPMQTTLAPDQLFHCALIIDGQTFIMASDMLASENFVKGNDISFAPTPRSEEELHKWFDTLKPEGQILQEPMTSPWGSIYASVSDKYGMIWAFDYQLPVK